jgi:hypothetical protein
VIYNHTIGSGCYQNYLKDYLDVAFGGTLRLFDLHVSKRDILAVSDERNLMVHTIIPPNPGGAFTKDIIPQLRDFIRQNSESKGIIQYSTDQFIETTAIFSKDENSTESAIRLKEKLIGYIDDIHGLGWIISGFGPPVSLGSSENLIVEHLVEISGYHLPSVMKLETDLKGMLLKNPRIVVRKSNGVGLDLWVLILKGQYRGLRQELATQLSVSAPGLGLYNRSVTAKDGRKHRLFIHGEDNMPDLWRFFQAPIFGRKLKDVTELDKVSGQVPIIRKNQEYIRSLNLSYLGKNIAGRRFINNAVNDISREIPIGYEVNLFTPELSDHQTVQLIPMLILIMLLIYVVCAVLFESLVQPISVIALIPFSLTGIFLIFFLTNVPFGKGGYAAIFLLSGITVNAAIYIVDAYNNFLKEGEMSAIKALALAFHEKLVPIILTIASTIAGLTPFLFLRLSDPFWYALSLGAIGGLCSSLVAVFLILPVMLQRSKH